MNILQGNKYHRFLVFGGWLAGGRATLSDQAKGNIGGGSGFTRLGNSIQAQDFAEGIEQKQAVKKCTQASTRR